MQELQTEKLQPFKLPQLPDAPLVSVLIANYNYSQYIGETIESVLSQTYTNFEVIVCDDGSKDNSCEVIETYVKNDSRVKLIRKENGGVASALNAAYRESKGDIICILDADDTWTDKKLEKVIEAFKSESQNGFVIHNVILIDGQGNFIKLTPKYKELASGWMAESALENGGFVENIPPASALNLRREVAKLIFPLNEFFRTNADSLIFRLAPFITVIGAIPDVLSKFRFHRANTTSQLTVTPEVLQRDLAVMERVHQEQKVFLTKVYGAAIAERLTDLQSNLIVCNARYLLARLSGKSKNDCKEAHQQLITHPEFANCFNEFLLQRWLVQWGEYLPDPLFAALFNQVYGSSRLKQLGKQLLKGRLMTNSINSRNA
ncbi:glycosyltransferase family 2 protein [Nostoc sp. 106C]|uniref:glycosyltransferase family 2 protein n=1 Tax=Nostoc sp. 106C TaxID=1932667 RepID=UPI000A37CB28|nr:glycosyltransferase family 2 protein [Nostoc sp. 106C]OUL31385.1 glycosyl transferase family 2 [Nostoc sp. 106C]